MALARWDPFSPRKADRLFGSVVRYYGKTSDSEELAFLMFACGCQYSIRKLRRRRFCHRHRGQA